MKTVPLILVLSLGLMGTVGFPQEIEETELPEGFFSKSYELRSTSGGELTFCLRYPPVGKEKVKGVLFFCTPGAPDNYVSGGHLRNFVEAQDLAVVGFGQPGRRWNTTVNTDLLSNREAAEQNRVMNEVAREWSSLAKRFCREFELPSDGWLIYGTCGGAQFAHRLAFRAPDLFLAVHVHYGGSYDEPDPRGRSIQWLVTTHADEPSYIAAQHFFSKCRELNFPIILKGYTRRSAPELYEPDFLGGGSGGMQELSRQFFKNALRKARGEGQTLERFVADIVNGSVFPEQEGAWIPKSQSVILEGSELAKAWER